MTSRPPRRDFRDILLVAFMLLIAWPDQPWAAEPIIGSPIGFRLAERQSADLTIEDLCCEKADAIFSGSSKVQFKTLRGRHTYWLRLDPISTPGILDFGTLGDDLVLFAVDSVTKKITHRAIAGDQRAASERDVIATHNAFELTREQLNQALFVRMIQDNDLAIRPRLVSKAAFERRERDAVLVHTFVIGSAFIILVFNLLLGLFLRKFLFVAYALFVGSLILSNLVISGMGPAYVWPTWSNATGLLREIGMVGNLLFFGLMIYAFLNERTFHRLSQYAILVPAVLAVPIGSLWWVLPQWQAHFLISLYMMASALLLVGAVIYLAQKKMVRARILLPTLILVIIPTVLALVLPKNAAIVWPINRFSIESLLMTDHLFELVVLLDSLLFSLLFAFQIRMAESQSYKASQELTALQGSVSRKIIDAVDVERRRIASDLHDTAGQGMLAVSSRLSQLLRKEKFTKAQQVEIKRSADYSCGIVGDIRRISHDLHPASIDHLGWRSAIEELFEQLSENTDIQCKLDIQVPEESLSEFQKLHLYRISQEIIANIAKHANASRCEAYYGLENDHLIAQFSDDGMFQPPGERKKTSLGHLIIDQRIQALDGNWETDLTDGTTRIRLRFPVKPCVADQRTSA